MPAMDDDCNLNIEPGTAACPGRPYLLDWGGCCNNSRGRPEQVQFYATRLPAMDDDCNLDIEPGTAVCPGRPYLLAWGGCCNNSRGRPELVQFYATRHAHHNPTKLD